MSALLTQAAYESSRVLAGLSAAVPRLRTELPGWVAGHLLPALDGFNQDATDSQIADALVYLRHVLRARAAVDPWLGDIADLGVGEYAGDSHAMNWATDLAPRVALTPEPIGNRTVVDHSRQLRAALLPNPSPTTANRSTPPSPLLDATS